MARLTKRTKHNYDGLDREQLYAVDKAVHEVKKRATSKFQETVEISVNLALDPRKAEQNIRGMVSLPHGTGKTLRVAVFAKGPKAEEAKKAGADIVGAEDLMEIIQKGEINFDRCIATPDMMGVVGRLGQVLGPRGLMPNPKLGTVTMDVAKAVADAKAGQIEYRLEKAGIVHAGVAKASMDEKQIAENVKFFLETLTKARPAGVKGEYMKRITISSTMGPGIKVDPSSLAA